MHASHDELEVEFVCIPGELFFRANSPKKTQRTQRLRKGGETIFPADSSAGWSHLFLTNLISIKRSLGSYACVLRGPGLPASVALDVGVGETQPHVESLALFVVAFYVIDAGYHAGGPFNSRPQI